MGMQKMREPKTIVVWGEIKSSGEGALAGGHKQHPQCGPMDDAERWTC